MRIWSIAWRFVKIYFKIVLEDDKDIDTKLWGYLDFKVNLCSFSQMSRFLPALGPWWKKKGGFKLVFVSLSEPSKSKILKRKEGAISSVR